ncbi:hypothetical protein TARUN_409 [Trichoderma arundinaceum]|uniref:Uncharacterized protein n=1 Tax=Trichoderma arundinaceum TaxID=490622 RepID=A0A395P0E3_TRIAR|nr:hypothetical protein TARUN_409 [Trichoderma arundinaceum]
MSVKAKSLSEKIIPLSAKDQAKPVNNIRTLLFIVVRDILDGEFMKASLDKLIRTHIPLLGARIKPSGPDGFLQYHSILPFPDNYEIFRWSVSNVSSTLGEANLVPEQNSQKGITILPDVTVSERWWTPADWPIVLSDEKPDTPLLLVHLTYYTDATVITLSLPHSVCDQMGFGSVVNSWIDVMKGKEPLPFIDLPEGALDGDKSISKKELHKKYEYRLKTKAERAEVLMGLVPELIVRSKETRCIFYMPVGIVNGLRDRWREELKGKHGSEAVDISNGDVLVGVLVKFANMHRKKPKKQSITGPANLRGIHPSLPKGQHYLHNALSFCVNRAAVSRSKPLASELAYGNRLAIIDCIKPANIERNLAITRELATRKIGMHICEPWEFSYSTTNWCNAWHGIDFSVASIRKTGNVAEKKNVDGDNSSEDGVQSMGGAASAPLIFGHSLERNHPIRLGSVVMSKAEGGYWIDFAAPDEGMAAIKALLEKDPNLETI